MNDAFISYQWNSKTEIHEICRLLESRSRYKLWIDKDKMIPGDNLFTEMENGIKNSKIFIGFITKAYCESENCKREIRFVNSLPKENKKRCIYVMLENETAIGTNTDGVALLIAGCLRLNAYVHVDNNKLDVEKVYNELSGAIDAFLNNKPKSDNTIGSVLMDLESMIKCSVNNCKQACNLVVEEDLPNCAKPMQTECKKLICYKCYNIIKHKNGQFKCPLCGIEHDKPKNAFRLHNIIKYFYLVNSFKNLKKDIRKYKFKSGFVKQELFIKVNETKESIKEHVERIITDLNNYLSSMFQDLDNYVKEWKDKQKGITESLKLDETITANETSLSNIENNLKQIEISLSNNNSVEKEMQSVETGLVDLEKNINKSHAVLRENDLIKADSFLTYKKGRGINNDLRNIIGTFEPQNLIFTDPYKPTKCGSIIKEIRLEVFQNDEMEKYLKAIQNQNDQLKRNIEQLNKQVRMLTSKDCVKDDELITLCEGKQNNYQKIKQKIINKNFNPNYKNAREEVALIEASQNGHKEIVQLLIDNGAIVNEKDKYGWTALMEASLYGHKEIVQLLIDNGAIVNERNNDGWAPLMSASEKGHKEIVQLLIGKGAIVNEKTCYRKTALMSASLSGHKEIVQLLIDNGAIVNEKNNNDETALMWASKLGCKEIVQLLIDNGAIVNEKNKYGWTPLMSASENGHKEIVQLLIDNGAIVNEKVYGMTALTFASQLGCKEIVQFLIDNGAIVNEKKNDGWKALMQASQNGHKEIVQLLIDNGAIVNEKRNDGWTALMEASRNGHKEIVQLLIDNGAIVNEKNKYGWTPLMSASLYGHKEIAQLLKDNGAV